MTLLFAIILGAPFVLVLVLYATRYLEQFVLFAVLGSIAFPASVAHVAGVNIDTADLLLILALFSWSVNYGVGLYAGSRLPDKRVLVAALVFLIVNAASILWSGHRRTTSAFVIQLIEITLVYPFTLGAIPRSVAHLRRGMTFFVFLTLILSLATLFVYAAGISTVTSENYLPGIGKNPLGCFTAAGAIIAIALALSPGPRRPRLTMALVACVGIVATVATGSRGAMIGMVAALILVPVLLRAGKMSHKLVVLMVIAFMGLAYVAVIAPARHTNLTTAGSYDSTNLRLTTWGDAVKKIEARPWIGTGARTYSDAVYNVILPDPNNLFLLTWAELGIPGMLTLLALLYQMARLAYRVSRLDRESAALGAAAAGVVVSLIVHFQVDISWVRGETTLEFAMVGVMLALQRLAGSPEAAPAVLEPAGRYELGPDLETADLVSASPSSS